MSISPVNVTTVNQYSAPDQSQGQVQGSNQTQGSNQSQESSQVQGQSQTQGSGHTAEPSLKQIQAAVDKINNVVHSANTDVQFKVDHSSGRVVVQVMDTHNHEVLRQIPSKETMAIAQALDKLQGIIIHNQA